MRESLAKQNCHFGRINQLLNFFLPPLHFFFFFNFRASGGELQTLLDNDEIPEEKIVKRFMRQILDGLEFLHSVNVAHLDIKVRLLNGVAPRSRSTSAVNRR